jgi:hypothetical protein
MFSVISKWLIEIIYTGKNMTEQTGNLADKTGADGQGTSSDFSIFS